MNRVGKSTSPKKAKKAKKRKGGLPALTNDVVNERLRPRKLSLAEDVVNARHRTLIRCRNNHTWRAVLSSVMQGSGCPECSKKPTPLTEKELEIRCNKCRVRFVIPFVTGTKRTDFECLECGAIFNSLVSTLLTEKSNCPHCRKPHQRKFDQTALANKLSSNGLTLLSEFSGLNKKGLFCCTNGHEFTRQIAHVFYKNGSCPVCHPRRKIKELDIHD